MQSFKCLCVVSAFTACSMLLPAKAETSQLSFTLKDGSTVVLDLTPGSNGETKLLPVMTFTPTTVKVALPPKPASEGSPAQEGSSYEFEVSNLASVEAVDPETTSLQGITVPTGDLKISYKGGDVLLISGNDALNISDIMVYDINGRRQNVEINGDENGVTLSLTSLNSGVYILNTGVTSIKIVKK